MTSDALGRAVAVDSSVTCPDITSDVIGRVLHVTTDDAWVVVAWPDGSRDVVRPHQVVVLREVDRTTTST